MADKKEELEVGATFYVDGGCRSGYPFDEANRKYGGWGFHGYTYNIGVKPPKIRSKKDIPTTKGYLDGSKVPHDEQVVVTGYIDAYGSLGNKDDSTQAELAGFRNVVEFIKDKGYKKIHFLLDNQYVIQGVTEGYDKWSSLNWKNPNGGSYANKDVWDKIMASYKPLSDVSEISIEWVNGHSGNLGNDRADYLATKGVYLGRNGTLHHSDFKSSSISNYRNPKVDINRLFTKARWYFNTQEEPLMSKDGRYVYHCGHHGSDDTLVGKPTSTCSAYIVYTKEPMEVLEAVRQHHAKLIPNPYNELCMAHLDTLLLPRIYDEIKEDGPDVLSLAPRKLRYDGLTTIDEKVVTKVIRPSGLTFRLIEWHNFMERQLDYYLNGEATTTDITSLLYQETIKKNKNKEVKKNEFILDTSKKVIKANVLLDNGKHHNCTLTFGIDCPPKELMAAIADRYPKVYITTWSLSDAAFRYGIIFDCGDDVLMWTGKDSSMQLVRN